MLSRARSVSYPIVARFSVELVEAVSATQDVVARPTRFVYFAEKPR